MAKTKAKTTESAGSVADFIKSVPDQERQADCTRIIEIMKKQSGSDAKMWGSAIIGFGSYHYKYESGREGDAPLVAFSPRKDAISLYLSLNDKERDELLNAFGKFKAGKGCIYIKRLEDISIPVLEKMISLTIKHYREKYKS